MGSVICLVFILLWVQTGDQFQTETRLQTLLCQASLSPGDGWTFSHSSALIQSDGVRVCGSHDGPTETQPGRDNKLHGSSGSWYQRRS